MANMFLKISRDPILSKTNDYIWAADIKRVLIMDKFIPFLMQHGYTVPFIWVFVETMGLPLLAVPLLITMGPLLVPGKI
jgi:hypothetical protein